MTAPLTPPAGVGFFVACALVGLAALWIADLVRRPRIRPHADDLPPARDLDEHEASK